MTDYVCTGMGRVRVWMSVCVCVHNRALCKMGQGYSRGKKRPPPYLILHPPASRLCLSKLDFILQKQSGMNNSFSSPCFLLFRSFIPLSDFFASLSFGILYIYSFIFICFPYLFLLFSTFLSSLLSKVERCSFFFFVNSMDFVNQGEIYSKWIFCLMTFLHDSFLDV